MKRFAICLVLITFLISCSTHHGTISSSSVNRNVKYMDIAFGVSQTNKYFGLGGVSQDALMFEAKRELIKNRPLKPNEQYLNFTIDFKRTYFIIFNQTKITVSADVVRFTSDTISDPYSDIYKTKLLEKITTNDLFEIGDTVMDSKLNIGTIISLDNIDNARILFRTAKDKIRTKRISINSLYTNRKTYKKFKVGNNYEYNMTISDDGITKYDNKIIAIGLHSLIVSSSSGGMQIIKF